MTPTCCDKCGRRSRRLWRLWDLCYCRHCRVRRREQWGRTVVALAYRLVTDHPGAAS